MISKKILSEVLGYTPYKIDSVKKVSGVGLTLILLNKDNTVRAYWNIYELMNKCKQWIYDKGYGLYVSIEHPAYTIIVELSILGKSIYINDNDNTEPDAVFEACEWLYKELEYKGKEDEKI